MRGYRVFALAGSRVTVMFKAMKCWLAEMGSTREARDLGLLSLLTLALHVPFVGQAFHLDDVTYLDIARNVFAKPLFPLDLPYVVFGRHVTMWGHPHPPLNSYLIAGVLLLRGGAPSEIVLHTVYLLFPLLATVSFYFLARRFSSSPLLATAIFATLPDLLVVAHTLEPDVALLALWLSAVAIFIYGIDGNNPRLEAAAALPLAAAMFWAYQGVALIPLLAFYAFQRRRLTKRTAALLCLPLVLLLGWQLLGYLHKGSFYVSTLFGYMDEKGVWLLRTKIRNAASTLGTIGGTIVLFPFLLAAFGRRWKGLASLLGLAVGIAGVLAAHRLSAGYSLSQKTFFVLCFAGGFVTIVWTVVGCFEGLAGNKREPDTTFLSLWLLGVVFYCIAISFLGSARYMLTGAAPLVLLLVRATETRLEAPRGWRAFYATLLPCQLVLGLSLAWSDYEVAQVYRQFARDFSQQYLRRGDSFSFTGEWGFRYYLSELGGRVLAEDSAGRHGELVVKSQLCGSRTFDNDLERSLGLVERRSYRISSPLRLLDPHAKAGYWSDGWGVLPFWFSSQALDEITVYRVGKAR